MDVFFKACKSSETGGLSFCEQCIVQFLHKVRVLVFVLIDVIVIVKVVFIFGVLFFLLLS